MMILQQIEYVKIEIPDSVYPTEFFLSKIKLYLNIATLLQQDKGGCIPSIAGSLAAISITRK